MPQFQKGQSGNPGGRPKIIGEIRDLAREHTAEAIAALAKICRSGKSEAARIAAATALLDRAFGKPVQAIHTTPNDPAALTDGELAAIIRSGGSAGAAEPEDPLLN